MTWEEAEKVVKAKFPDARCEARYTASIPTPRRRRFVVYVGHACRPRRISNYHLKPKAAWIKAAEYAAKESA